MAIGWRMADDLETLAEIPDGSIQINLLNGTAIHSVNGELNLRIAKEMQAWLKQRFTENHIPIEKVLVAEVWLNSKTDRIKNDKKRVVSFDWDCHSNISTDEKKYESHLTEAHTWHNRIHNSA